MGGRMDRRMGRWISEWVDGGEGRRERGSFNG